MLLGDLTFAPQPSIRRSLRWLTGSMMLVSQQFHLAVSDCFTFAETQNCVSPRPDMYTYIIYICALFLLVCLFFINFIVFVSILWLRIFYSIYSFFFSCSFQKLHLLPYFYLVKYALSLSCSNCKIFSWTETMMMTMNLCSLVLFFIYLTHVWIMNDLKIQKEVTRSIIGNFDSFRRRIGIKCPPECNF